MRLLTEPQQESIKRAFDYMRPSRSTEYSFEESIANELYRLVNENPTMKRYGDGNDLTGAIFFLAYRTDNGKSVGEDEYEERKEAEAAKVIDLLTEYSHI